MQELLAWTSREHQRSIQTGMKLSCPAICQITSIDEIPFLTIPSLQTITKVR